MHTELVQIASLNNIRSVKKISIILEGCSVSSRMLIHSLGRINRGNICGKALYHIRI